MLIGLGQTQNKRTVSSAIAKVSSKQIKELAVTRPEAALQGTATGTIFNPSFGTGGLNVMNQVDVNGVILNSMNIYTSPLYVLAAADQELNTMITQLGATVKWDITSNLIANASYSH